MSSKKEFNQFGEDKLEELKAKPFDELSNLDGYSFLWNGDNRKAELTVVIETVDKNIIRVILQGFLPTKLLSSGKHAFVDGFKKKKDGSIEPVSHNEISYYD